MASFIKVTQPKPTDAGTLIREAQYGIDKVLSGYIIQSLDINQEGIYDDTYNQKNQLVSRLQLDTHYTANMEVIGGDGTEDEGLPGLSAGMIDFKFQGEDTKWQVANLEYRGSYNDKKRYSITLERWIQFPGNLSA